MKQLTFGEKVGYSLGDVAANLVFQMMMIYQLKFYTDIFGLEGAVAGTVLLVAPLIGMVADPLAGIIADRTNTRWGKYRPWLLWTALPFALFYVLAFTNPGIADKTLVAVYATISYILLLTMYSFNNTPYASLGGVMTADIRQRTSITSIRFVASTIAQFVVQGLTLPLVNRFGGPNATHGWTMTIVLFASAAFVCSLIAFATTRERITPPPAQQMSIGRDMRETLGSVAWRAVFLLTLCLFVTLAMWGSGMNFYFQSYVDQPSLYRFLGRLGLVAGSAESSGAIGSLFAAFNLIAHSERDAYAIGFSLFNMTNALVQFLGVILLSNYLANHWGKKTTFLVCLSLTTVFTALFYLPQPSDVGSLYLLCVLKSLAYAPTIPILWSMVADVADHIEYTCHRRATGFCFSGVVCALKVGIGVGGALAGLLLSVFGYVSGGSALQSPLAVSGIRLVASILPAALFALGCLCILFYPITKKFNAKMQQELHARRMSSLSQ
ncbi:MAG: MFS transporter [Prevotella sp.]|nr:MFS transporter [Prevotella sp.]